MGRLVHIFLLTISLCYAVDIRHTLNTNLKNVRNQMRDEAMETRMEAQAAAMQSSHASLPKEPMGFRQLDEAFPSASFPNNGVILGEMVPVRQTQQNAIQKASTQFVRKQAPADPSAGGAVDPSAGGAADPAAGGAAGGAADPAAAGAADPAAGGAADPSAGGAADPAAGGAADPSAGGAADPAAGGAADPAGGAADPSAGGAADPAAGGAADPAAGGAADPTSATAGDQPTALPTSATAGAAGRGTPGVICSSWTSCEDCTVKSFFCIWSNAQNICTEDNGKDLEDWHRDQPELEWSNKCPGDVEAPTTNCEGCPIPLDTVPPTRDINDAQIAGSDGDEKEAVEGSLGLLHGQGDINDPITHPNGTNGPFFIVPSIKDPDGSIHDPVIDSLAGFTYSPCVEDGSCESMTSRFMSTSRHGKFTPIMIGADGNVMEDDNTGDDDDDSEDSEQDDEEPERAPRMQKRLHVDKVEMQDAEMSETLPSPIVQDTDKAADVDADVNDPQDNEEEEQDSAEPDEEEEEEEDSAEDEETITPVMELETGAQAKAENRRTSRVERAQIEEADVVESSDKDSSDSDSDSETTNQDSSSSSSDSTSSSSPSASSSSESPRFSQTHRMSSAKLHSSKDALSNTVEVTEFDDSVQGGRRIDLDADGSPSRSSSSSSDSSADIVTAD